MRIKHFFYCLLFLITVQIGSVTVCFAQKDVKTKQSPVAGNTYAIIFAVSDYPFIKQLRYADKDGELFSAFLQSDAGGNINRSDIKMLLNENATRGNFWTKGISWLEGKKLQKGDRVYLYFAGHADAIDKDDCFFLAYDCRPEGDKNNYNATGAIPMESVKNEINRLSIIGVDVVLIMDACRTNELPGGETGQRTFTESVIEKRSGETMMFAANSGQESMEASTIGNGHGLFTWYLVNGLLGNADADPNSGNQDGKVDLFELENWVTRNVVKDAQQRFNFVQQPYFCCLGVSKTMTVINKNHLEISMIQEMANKLVIESESGNVSLNYLNNNDDAKMINLKNLFNKSIKENRLIGDSTADYWYNKMKEQYPTEKNTEEAKSVLASELISFAQDKINMYLSGNDYNFQRGSISEGKKLQFEERLKVVAKMPFDKVANMLEKGISLAKESDSTIEKQYLSRLYFLKARAILSEDESIPFPSSDVNDDLKKGFEYARLALSMDSNNAYVYHLLAMYEPLKGWRLIKNQEISNGVTTSRVNVWNNDSLHVNIDSIEYYEKKAIEIAPNWSHAYYNMASSYIWAMLFNDTTTSSSTSIDSLDMIKNPRKLDLAKKMFKKCIEINSNYVPAYLKLGWIADLQSKHDSALFYIKKALFVEPESHYYYPQFVEYFFKVNADSGIYYYKKFQLDKDKSNLGPMYTQIIEYAISRNDETSSCFFFKEYLCDEAFCLNPTIGYALIQNKKNIAAKLMQILDQPENRKFKSTVFNTIASQFYDEKDYVKALNYYFESVKTKPSYSLNGNCYGICCCFSLLKNETQALFYFGKSLQAGYKDYSNIKKDADLNFIRNTPKFKSLMKQYFPMGK